MPSEDDTLISTLASVSWSLFSEIASAFSTIWDAEEMSLSAVVACTSSYLLAFSTVSVLGLSGRRI